MPNKKNAVMDERARLITLRKPSSVASEQFRTIRTNIQYSMADKEIKSLVITSEASKAGKSTVAANLAITFAMQGKKVLLVDADMRKPTVHKTFRLSNRDGLTTLLTDKYADPDLIMHRMDIENLFIITSGAIPPNPSELLSSKRMDALMAKLEKKFEMIIFDTPPIIAVTDAQIMASKVDGTVFVLRQGAADKTKVAAAKELLDMVNANVIGTVFNRVENHNDEDYYYSQKDDD